MLAIVQRWLRARATLGWALFKHVLLRPFASGRSDPTKWLHRIGKEHLGATPKDNWRRFATSGRCIGCGLCDMFGSTALQRPSLLILGAARLPSDAPFVADSALQALLTIAPEVAAICPQGVDTRAIHAIVRNNQKVLHGVRELQ